MPLPPAFLDELRARTPLHGLIGRGTRLTRNGRQWKGCCPFHQEKTPSFYVYDDHFHCFGCGAHGDAMTFLMRAEGASFPEAVERLAAEAGLEVPKPTPQAAARERRARDLHGVLAAAEAVFRTWLLAPEGRAGLDYLRGRGLSADTIARFGLGWSGGGRGALAAALREEGIEAAQLVEAGLCKPREGGGTTDFFFDRVMFPIRDRRGRTISFGGRVLGDGQPKYLNGPETSLFRKRGSLYALDLAREGAFRGAPVVVVEGYMDVIALHAAGFPGAVAPLGTALTEEQLQALWALSPEPVICFDGDAAGARAAARTAELALPALAPSRTLRLASLPANEDPDTLVRRGGAAAFAGVLAAARPLSTALYDLLAGARLPEAPEARAAIRTRLAEAASRIGDRALASEYRRALLDRFFAASRRGAPRPGVTASARPVADPAGVRLERARNLLAILLHHPTLLPEIEEALGGLEWPPGPAAQLAATLLGAIDPAQSLDSATLLAHLASLGLDEAVTWAMQPHGLTGAARPDAQPKEALDGWWHFFGLLRGEGALAEECRAAEDALASTNDPAAQLRLIRLTEARAKLRHDEVDGPRT